MALWWQRRAMFLYRCDLKSKNLAAACHVSKFEPLLTKNRLAERDGGCQFVSLSRCDSKSSARVRAEHPAGVQCTIRCTATLYASLGYRRVSWPYGQPHRKRCESLFKRQSPLWRTLSRPLRAAAHRRCASRSNDRRGSTRFRAAVQVQLHQAAG